jgi:membrane protein required for colicin V production
MESRSLASLQAHWVDLAMLGWLAVSMLIGLLRGLVFEAFSLVGWGVAYFAAHWAAPALAPQLPLGAPGSALNHAAAFLCAFVAVLIVWGLLARLLRMLVRATPLNLPDRLLGAGFGAVRGVIVLLIVAGGIGFTPVARSMAWRQSQCAAWLNEALHGLKPIFPSEFSQHLPA